MKRVICHWTAGQHKSSALDREHYHFLIESDGTVVRGNRTVEDNVSTSDGIYAAHTRSCNTGSIGVAVCCMAGAHEKPFQAGACPMTQKQWDVMCGVVAELCRFYDIKVGSDTVLGHGEVEINLGIKQLGKWDPMVLPWNPGLSRAEVGSTLRTMVRNHLQGPSAPEALNLVTIRLRGTEVGKAVLSNGSAFASANSIARQFGWTVSRSGSGVRFKGEGSPSEVVPVVKLEGESYVDVQQMAEDLGQTTEWDPVARILSIT